MEKLQAAIEKARAQRLTAHSRKEGRSTETQGVSERWGQMKTMGVPAKSVRRNRLVSSKGGADAAPFDMLRTRIYQQAIANEWKRVAIISPTSGCGKSTLVANLVFSFSRQADVRTFIFDLDLRRPNLAGLLGQTVEFGMGDVLQGHVSFEEHALRYGQNVALGLTDKPTKTASEILQSQHTATFLNALDETYEPGIMLFDLPPLLATDDNFGFLRNVDCALLIAEAEKTTIDQIDLAERQLAELTNVMGVVLNKSRFAKPTEVYGY